MLETQEQAAPAKRLDSLAQNVAVLLVFLLPILFLPSSWFPFAYGKVVLLALASLVPLVIWGVARFREGVFIYPSSYVLWFALLLPVVYLVSALLSGNVANSIVGSGFESNTFIFVLLLVAIFAVSSVVFTSVSSVVKMLLALGTSFTVLAFVQIVRLLFGAENILPSVFSSDVTATLIGSWNDLAVFSGFIVIVAIVALVYAPRTRFIRVLTYTNLAMALFLLVVVNLQVVWVILALLSAVLFMYFVSAKRAGAGDYTEGQSKGDLVKMVAPAVVFIISIIFVFAGGSLGPKASGLMNVQYVDVRPSWEGTIEVAKGTYSDSALLGTGPNTFSNAWMMHKPTGVNNTNFWNIDFRSGIGLIPTAFITVGLVGGLIWLLFAASVMYTAFKMLWARMPNDMTRFIVFATVGGALYLLILLMFYVPQTVMLAFTFLIIGLLLAVARNVNAVRTRRVSTSDSQATSFAIMLTFTTVAVTALFIATVITQRIVTASVLGSSANAAQNENLERAQILAERARSLSAGGFFGKDDRAYSVLAQLGILNLRKVLQEDQKSEGYKENLQTAIEGVILPARAAIDADPNNYSNHLFLGNIYEQLVGLGIDGAYDAAIASYSRARTLNPTNPSLPLMMARAAFATDKLDVAEAYAMEALGLKRNYTDAYFLLSQIAIKGENVEQAIATTESAAILAPNNPGILFQLGVLLYSTEEYQKAAQIFARAVTLNPSYANALYYLGLSSAQLGDTETALKAFERVSELNPENEDIKKIIESIKAGQLSVPAQPDATTAPVVETSQ